MDCRRAEELFSDDLDGTLHGLLQGELDAHLRSCGECAALRASFAVVVGTLQADAVSVDAPEALAERAARRAIAAGHGIKERMNAPVPRWLQALAAAAALVIAGGSTWIGIKGEPGRLVLRARDRVVNAGVQFVEQKDRLAEDLRLMRIVVGTAFEARLDRVNDRVDDYRRLLEKRRSEGARKESQEAPPKARPGAGAHRISNPGTIARVTEGERTGRHDAMRPRTTRFHRSA